MSPEMQLAIMANHPFTYGLTVWEASQIHARLALGHTAWEIAVALGWLKDPPA